MARLTRRRFLKAALIGGGVATVAPILAACGATPAPAATPTVPISAAKIVAPTPAPAQAATKPSAAPATGSAPASGAAPGGAATKPAAAPQAYVAGTGSTDNPNATDPGAPGPEITVKPPSGKDPVTLRFHMRSGGEKNEPAIHIYRPNEWAERTGNKVKLEPIPGDQNYIFKLQALASSGTAGDLTWSSDGRNEYRHLVRFGVLEPVDAYLQSNKIGKDEWRKSVIDTLSTGGKTYALPKAGYAGQSWIYVNLKAFREAGLKEPPTYGTTFDELADWANKLSKGPKDKRDAYGFYSNVTGNQPITSSARQFGADLVSPDGTTSTVDSDAFIDYLKWQHRIIVQDRVHPASDVIKPGDSGTDTTLAAMFAAEKVAMVHGDRSFQFLARNAVKDKFEFTAIQYPRGPKAIGYPAVCAGHCGIAQSKFKDESFSLLYAIADKRFAYLVGKFQGYLTGRANNLEELGPYKDDPFIQLQFKNEGLTAPMWVPKNLRSYEFESALNSKLDLLWQGKKQPDKAFATELKADLDQVLAKAD